MRFVHDPTVQAKAKGRPGIAASRYVHAVTTASTFLLSQSSSMPTLPNPRSVDGSVCWHSRITSDESTHVHTNQAVTWLTSCSLHRYPVLTHTASYDIRSQIVTCLRCVFHAPLRAPQPTSSRPLASSRLVLGLGLMQMRSLGQSGERIDSQTLSGPLHPPFPRTSPAFGICHGLLVAEGWQSCQPLALAAYCAQHHHA